MRICVAFPADGKWARQLDLEAQEVQRLSGNAKFYRPAETGERLRMSSGDSAIGGLRSGLLLTVARLTSAVVHDGPVINGLPSVTLGG